MAISETFLDRQASSILQRRNMKVKVGFTNVSRRRANVKLGLSFSDIFWKRIFDVVFSCILLFCLWFVVLILFLIASLDTKSSGHFTQKRVGRNGRLFTIYKIKTIRPFVASGSITTLLSDLKISRCGAFLRRTKLDEMPQLWNILRGDMSFVGPRPDVPEAYIGDKEDLDLLFSVRPGLTGPASLAFYNEERLLQMEKFPDQYSRDILMPKKIELNLQYVLNYSLRVDIKIILRTIASVLRLA